VEENGTRVEEIASPDYAPAHPGIIPVVIGKLSTGKKGVAGCG
jgi:hypothetical protein